MVCATLVDERRAERRKQTSQNVDGKRVGVLLFLGSVGSVVRVGSPVASLLVVCCLWFVPVPLCFKRKGGDPGTDQFSARSEDPADWHRPENWNFFQVPPTVAANFQDKVLAEGLLMERLVRHVVLRFLVRIFVEAGTAESQFSAHSSRPFAVVDVEASHFTSCRGSRVSFNFVHVFEATQPLSQSSCQSSSGAQALALGRATVRRIAQSTCRIYNGWCTSHAGGPCAARQQHPACGGGSNGNMANTSGDDRVGRNLPQAG